MKYQELVESAKRILLAGGIFIVAAANILQIAYSSKTAPTDRDLRDVMPDAHFFSSRNNPVSHYRGFIKEKDPVSGVIVETSSVDPEIKGYGDEISLLVGLDRKGRITGVKLLAHKETPSYIGSVIEAGFLDSFVGKNVQSSFSDISAVTGATITSKAIKEDIRSSAVYIARSALDIHLPPYSKGSDASNIFSPETGAAVFILILSLISFFNKKYTILRNICLVLSVSVLGIYLNTFLYLGTVTNLLFLKFPSVDTGSLFVLTLFVLITTPFIGPLFCSHVCPFGALSELVYRFFPSKLQPSGDLVKRISPVRYLFLFLCIIMIFGFNNSNFIQVEPFIYIFSWIHGAKIGIMWLYIVGVMIISAFLNRFYCRIFCPTGLCLSIISNIRLPWLKTHEKG